MSWANATLALRLLAQDASLGGLTIRARPGPVRDAFLRQLPFPVRRLHPTMGSDVLTGGLDLTQTLATGQTCWKQGLLQQETALLLPMAERLPANLAALLAQSCDMGGPVLILLDEGAAPDELPPACLTEKLAFYADLTDVALADVDEMKAQSCSATASHSDDVARTIVQIAAQCGIDSLRAPLFALKAAKAHAVISNRGEVDETDIAAACGLTFAHRAVTFPTEDHGPEEAEKPDTDTEHLDQSSERPDIPNELVLDAIRALLPEGLLERTPTKNSRHGQGSGHGSRLKGNRKGRPLPPRRGRKSQGRIDLVATLRAAAPWQTIRKRQTERDQLQIRASDLHVKRFEDRSDRVLIFAVDASGSAALARLAEVKGAVELMLGQAYAKRDYVSLISFRGKEAETLLPPTRSLVQTKRRLAAMPGGGGTPLAAGMETALREALLARRRGMTPTICILTDGRANVARDGIGDRPRAASDAEDMARLICAEGLDAIVIDTGKRPERKLKSLAESLAAAYIPLPRADAASLSETVMAAMDS